jgi:predicted lactoylglutathione lyase
VNNKFIFVNLPVKDVQRTIAFFKSLGYGFNPEYTDEKAACMVVSDSIHVMHLSEAYFQTFARKPVADAGKTTEVLLCLSCDSRAQVDELVAKAVKAGGSAPRPVQDLGFMYSHGFEDLDGHVWELAYMAPGEAPPAA